MEQLGESYGALFKFRIGQTLKDDAIRVKAFLVKAFIFSDGLRDRYSLRYHGTATFSRPRISISCAKIAIS